MILKFTYYSLNISELSHHKDVISFEVNIFSGTDLWPFPRLLGNPEKILSSGSVY